MRVSLNQPMLAMLAMLVGLAFTVPASCMACSLDPPDPMLLKQRMAKEIAFRLAIDVAQVPLTDITAPELHRPLELEPDCSGLASWHHSSGFRIVVVRQQHAFATMAAPRTAAGAGSQYRGRLSSGFYAGRPQQWLGPKPKAMYGVNYSGYIRWPQYPRERALAAAAAAPGAEAVDRWPQYPDVPAYLGAQRPAEPTRWSTMSAMPAQPPVQGFCRYEGVAVVLGHAASSPVAVHFKRQCE